MKISFRVFGFLLLIFAFPPGVFAQDSDLQNLASMSLEQLMQVDVSIASHNDEAWTKTPGAVFVLTHDEIIRSGARSIPEALRLVPGLIVAQISSNTWSVASRGFQDRFSNSLLVMVDGRVIYSHLFGGVFWDQQDLLVEDVDRIEVIRGPGSSIWGSNAVSGVINIITRSAKKTLGFHTSVGSGTDNKADLAIEWGEALGKSSWIKGWGQYFKGEPTTQVGEASDAADGWQYRRGGVRADGERPSGAAWTFQAQGSQGVVGDDLYYPVLSPPGSVAVPGNTRVEDGSLQFGWKSPKDQDWVWAASAYGQTNQRKGDLLNGSWRTGDLSLDVIHNVGESLQVIGGLEGRVNSDDLFSSRVSWDEQSESTKRLSGYLQAEQDLWDKLVTVTAGSKLEYDAKTTWLMEPTLRLGLSPSEHWFGWAALSRSDRILSRAEEDVRFDYKALQDILPVMIKVAGTDGLAPIIMGSAEMGIRWMPNPKWASAFTVYDDHYRNLLGLTVGDPVLVMDPIPHLEITNQTVSGGGAHLWGGETWAQWQPTGSLRLKGWASYYREVAEIDPNTGSGYSLGQTPRWQASFQASWDPTCRLKLDASWRYVDPLTANLVPAYQTMDARVAWHPMGAWEIAVTGRNLFAPRHVEFITDFLAPVTSEISRSYFLNLSWGW